MKIPFHFFFTGSIVVLVGGCRSKSYVLFHLHPSTAATIMRTIKSQRGQQHISHVHEDETKSSSWAESWKDVVEDVVFEFVAPSSASLPLEKQPIKVDIQTFRYVEERTKTGSIGPERESVEVEILSEASTGSVSTLSSRHNNLMAIPLDQVVQKTITDVSNFFRSYTEAQVEAESREAPVSYAVDRLWKMNDLSVMHPTIPIISGPSRRKSVDLVPPCDLEIVGASQKNVERSVKEGLILPDRPLDIAAVSEQANNPRLVSPVVTSGARTSLNNAAFDSAKKTLPLLDPAGGLEGRLNRPMDAVVCPEKQLGVTGAERKNDNTYNNTHTNRSNKVIEQDLLDHICEHVEARFCMAPLPSYNSTIKQVDQGEKYEVGNSTADIQSDVIRKNAMLVDLIPPTEDNEVPPVDDHVNQKSRISDFPDATIVIVTHWQEERISFEQFQREQKKGKKKRPMGRRLAGRHE